MLINLYERDIIIYSTKNQHNKLNNMEEIINHLQTIIVIALIIFYCNHYIDW